MNAFVAPPAPTGTRSANADWMELQAIRSAGRRSTIGDLLGIIDLIEDQAATVGPFDEETGETLDESILETHRNRPVDAVFGELAAGGYTAGEVVSFGFPRPTGTAFLPALRATYERFGAGTVKKSVPPGFPVATKDDVDRIGQFHGWFSEQPARHWLPSMRGLAVTADPRSISAFYTRSILDPAEQRPRWRILTSCLTMPTGQACYDCAPATLDVRGPDTGPPAEYAR